MVLKSVELDDWLEYLAESTGSPEQNRQLLHAKPIDPAKPVDKATTEKYFREGLYPYAERMSLRE